MIISDLSFGFPRSHEVVFHKNNGYNNVKSFHLSIEFQRRCFLDRKSGGALNLNRGNAFHRPPAYTTGEYVNCAYKKISPKVTGSGFTVVDGKGKGDSL